jgi:hypothetical protein
VDIHDASFNFLVPATVRGVYRSTPRGERAVPGRTPVPADESLRSDESGNPVTSLNWNEQFQYFATGVRMLYFHVEAPPGPLPVFLRVWAESLPDVDDRRTFEVPGLG